MNHALAARSRSFMSALDLWRLYLHLLGGTVLACALACFVAWHLVWNWTPSLPLGLYWLSRSDHALPVARGELVAFPVPPAVRDLVRERRYLPPGGMLVKRVVATPGDRVCADGGTFTVNGEPLGAILAEDSAGRPLPQYEGCGRVPEGLLYVGSHHPKSFDSRTFGPVRASDIRGTVTPLWTY